MAKNSEKVYSYFLPLFFQTEYKTTYQQNFSQLASAKTGVLFLNLAALACNSANNYRIQWTHISSRNICGKREPQMWGKLPSTCLWCLATVSWSSETLSWRCVMLADWQSKNICVYPLWHHFQFNTADIEMTSKKDELWNNLSQLQNCIGLFLQHLCLLMDNIVLSINPLGLFCQLHW